MVGLDLRHASLEDLPAAIISTHQQLTLQRVNISNNKLSELPKWIGRLGELRSLIAASNAICRIPPSIQQLGKLTELSLVNNALQGELPVAIARCTSLRSLNLAGNRISGLPHDFHTLQQLTRLDLHRNQLAEVPAVVAALPLLEFLLMSANPFRAPLPRPPLGAALGSPHHIRNHAPLKQLVVAAHSPLALARHARQV